MGLKGFIFTMDAIVAITIAIAMLATVAYMGFESIYPEKGYEELTYIADDIMNALTYLKVKEVKDKPTIRRLIEKKILSDADLEKSVLDLIGSFWYAGNASIAENISREVLEGIVDDICLNLTLENQTIYSSCNTQPKELVVSSRMETGYEAGRPVYGYIARAFLVSIRGKKDSSYVYFGGYEGDGNITKILTLPSFDTILEAYMELDVGSNFTLWINGNYSGFYVNGSAGGGFMRADKWVICNLTYRPENCSSFKEGENVITLNFTGNESYVGGGFIRVTYNTTELAPIVNVNSTRYRFPGIQGLINLYSSFYVPGNLTSMSVHLHYRNNYTTFLTIGNVTVWEDDTPTEMVVDIPNSTLASLLDYSELSEKTIPIRLGTKAFTIEKQLSADVVLITDVSGSMKYRLDSGNTGVTRDCCNGNPCSSIEELVEWMENDSNVIYDPSTKRISLAKCLDKYFVFKILNASDKNRISLISFAAEPGIRSSTSLTNDSSYLYNVIDNYPDNPSGGTCMCCAINKAYEILSSESSNERKKFVVFMSDGIPSHACKPSSANCHGTSSSSWWQGNCYGWQECCDCSYFPEATPPGYCLENCWPPSPDCCAINFVPEKCCRKCCACDCEIINANYSSYRVHQDLNATVYSIGFGPVSTCSMG
ncbi:MAG TPA: VWA domain-containing protein, partial [Archaeoglobus sp.]|nr:VWA domain-containing protein [Archaeoglobus sp.]